MSLDSVLTGLSIVATGVASAGLVIAAVGKQSSPAAVEHAIATVWRVGDGGARRLRHAVVAAEAGTAVLLVLPASRLAGAVACVALAAAFVLTGTVAAVRRTSVPCGCFGSTMPTLHLGVGTFVMSGVLLVLAAGVALPAAGRLADPATRYLLDLCVAVACAFGYAAARRTALARAFRS